MKKLSKTLAYVRIFSYLCSVEMREKQGWSPEGNLRHCGATLAGKLSDNCYTAVLQKRRPRSRGLKSPTPKRRSAEDP